jgi:hypothetical protein
MLLSGNQFLFLPEILAPLVTLTVLPFTFLILLFFTSLDTVELLQIRIPLLPAVVMVLLSILEIVHFSVILTALFADPLILLPVIPEVTLHFE